MPLTLTLIRCPFSVAPETRDISGGEFSIGRGAENDWVLPDPSKHLSKRHCIIAFRKGVWQVAGTSTNGTFVNRDDTPLESRSPHVLTDRDRLVLGEYEIEVRVFEDTRMAWDTPAPPRDSFLNPFEDEPLHPDRPEPSSYEPGHTLGQPAAALPDDFDPLAEDHAGPSREDHSPAVSDAIHLPPAQTVLPDDWDDDLSSPPAASRPVGKQPPASPPPPPAAPPSAAPPPAAAQPETKLAPQDDLMAAFLRGAGLDGLAVPDPARTMELLGVAFRATVSGIRAALIARSEVKREFRIEATQIRQRGNNPLKFSADDDDALTGLLGAGRRTNMGPDEAIADALTDMRLHEIATVTAMQAAVRALVTRLGPDRIREAKEPGGGLAMLGNRKARAWDAYEALHREVLRGLTDDFDSVFGKRFAQAYEQAMQELQSRREPWSDPR